MFKKNKINEEKEPLLQEVEQLEGQNSNIEEQNLKPEKNLVQKSNDRLLEKINSWKVNLEKAKEKALELENSCKNQSSNSEETKDFASKNLQAIEVLEKFIQESEEECSQFFHN